MGQRSPKTPIDHESTRGLSRGMSIIAWIVLLGMMTAFFQGKLNDQSNPNRTVDSSRSEDGRAEVVLQRNRMGHYVANGTINGVNVTFLLDTGATGVAISPELARRAGAPRGKAIVTRTANGNAQGFLTKLKSVQRVPSRIWCNAVKATKRFFVRTEVGHFAPRVAPKKANRKFPPKNKT